MLGLDAIRFLTNPRLIHILPNFVRVGVSYTVTVQVTSTKDATLFNTASVAVVVAPQSLLPQVNSGETEKSISAERNFVLDSALTTDPDQDGNQHLTYKWSCTTLIIPTANSPRTTISSDLLLPG